LLKKTAHGIVADYELSKPNRQRDKWDHREQPIVGNPSAKPDRARVTPVLVCLANYIKRVGDPLGAVGVA
jgi:hypothetical protein